MSFNRSLIVWVDLEMTGLDVEKDHILEISCILTDKDLNIVAEGPDIVIHQPDSILNSMNEWCIKTHSETGLTNACKESKISLSDAENKMMEFLNLHIKKGVCPLAGNTVYMDRIFIKKFMPKFDDYLHYRIIDVSTVKELSKRWSPKVYQEAPKKRLTHRSLDDIKESIEELKYYKQFMFSH